MQEPIECEQKEEGDCRFVLEANVKIRRKVNSVEISVETKQLGKRQ
jgi:hypothetical protein